MIRRALLPSLATLLAACAPASARCGVVSPEGCPPDTITHALSETYLCPPPRIVVRERADIPIHRFACLWPSAPWAQKGYFGTPLWDSQSELADRCGAHPSAEVSRDPERLALWRRLQDKGFGSFDSSFTAVYEATACGEHGFYACARTRRRNHCEGSSLISLGKAEPPEEP